MPLFLHNAVLRNVLWNKKSPKLRLLRSFGCIGNLRNCSRRIYVVLSCVIRSFFYGRPSFNCILRQKICPCVFLPLLIGDLTPWFRNCFEKILKNIFRAGMPCHERPDLYSSCLCLPERCTVPQAGISWCSVPPLCSLPHTQAHTRCAYCSASRACS